MRGNDISWHPVRQITSFSAMLLAPLAALAGVDVSCDQGCRPVTACAGNATPYLLCLEGRNSDVKLTWRVVQPLAAGQTLQVYAGNPARAAGIPTRAVEFSPEGAALAGSFTFKAEELGSGPLLVVTTVKSNKDESILSWIPFRTSTAVETRESLEGAGASGNWSIDVRPAFIQASAGWRELPRTRDTRVRTWFSMAADPMAANDADLDGSVAGIPGLVMQVSAPWPARQDWKSKVQSALGVPPNHVVKFESLQWEEMPDRTIERVAGIGPISLRNYYTVVTLFTNASTATYTAKDMGLSGSSRYFAHETSASLKQVDHPLLWASYSRDDYSSDGHLLELLRRHVEKNGPSLELGPVLRVNGDGGPAIYRAAFTLRVRPWSDDTTDSMRQPRAGVVGIDVLAVRTGIGGIKVPATNATGVKTDWICSVFDRCGADDGLASIDFNKPPRGWEVSPPQASTLTISGHVPLIEGIESVAEKSPDAISNGPPNFPATTQFALATSLQAGALVRRAGFLGRRIDGMVPINGYAQYVVRFTVATFPGQEIVVTDTPVTPSPDEISKVVITPPKKTISEWIKEWIRGNFALAGILLVAAFFALLLLIPGFRSLVSAFFGLIAALIRKATPRVRE